MITDDHIQHFKSIFPSVLENESMAAHTFLKIGGPARLYLVAPTAEVVVKAVSTAVSLGIPWYLIGAGSNLLVHDDGFQGLVIQAADRRQTIEGNQVTAAAGVFTGSLARATVAAGLTGFEWGIGVPGTIGGATYGDAGCFGGEMRDVVTSVDVYYVAKASRVNYSNGECQFGYRDSRFKHEPHIILNTTLELHPGDMVEGRAKLEEIALKRKDSQPQGAFSAGCLFKNFEYADEAALDVLRRDGDDIPSEMLAQKCISAGWLVEKLGIKGKIIGKAQVSPVHGNFLVNLGGARAQEVIALSSYVKMKVRDELGILLEDEVQYLGF